MQAKEKVHIFKEKMEMTVSETTIKMVNWEVHEEIEREKI